MVHLIFCLRRLPSLSRAEFQRYWRQTHAPLVQQHAAVLGIRRYVQAHTINPAGTEGLAAVRHAPDPFDGVAEIWIDLESLQALPTDARLAAGRALLEDEQRFIDLLNSPIFLAEDNVVIGS